MFDQIYICLAVLVLCAVAVVAIGAVRLRQYLIKNGASVPLQSADALAMPLNGSVVLFSFYVILRFIPKKVFNIFISFYLSVFSVFALGSFLKGYIRPSVLTGTFCVALGVWYLTTKSWVANNVLAFAMGVTALENVPVTDFASSFTLLCGLFFYDIFWVFGSDVMMTVATGVDGPIKLLFPQTIFGDHKNKSLLGLGDLIVPGLFISQTLVFSKDCAKRGTFYFRVALIAYTASLINTMAVMLIFQHGQPALLFIVPWLLITFIAAAAYKGDIRKAWIFDISNVYPEVIEGGDKAKGADKPKEADKPKDDEESFFGAVWDAIKELFGLGKPDDSDPKESKHALEKDDEKIKTA